MGGSIVGEGRTDGWTTPNRHHWGDMSFTDEELGLRRKLLSAQEWEEVVEKERSKHTVELGCVSKNNRLAKRLGLVGRVKVLDWLVVLAKYGFKCMRCREGDGKIAMSHVVPLQQGGEHSTSNIQPLCEWCLEDVDEGVDYRPKD